MTTLRGGAELERACSALGDRLVPRGVVADLLIVGGAAMACAYGAPPGEARRGATLLCQDRGNSVWWRAMRLRVSRTMRVVRMVSTARRSAVRESLTQSG